MKITMNMDDIMSLRSAIAARVGNDITDYVVMSYFAYDDLKLSLKTAICIDDLEAVKYTISLLERESHAFYSSESCAKLAARHGSLSVVKYFVSKEYDNDLEYDGGWLLLNAGQNRHEDVVKFLLSCNASIDGSCERDQIEWITSSSENMDLMEYLLKLGATIDFDDGSGYLKSWLFMDAICKGKLNLVKYICDVCDIDHRLDYEYALNLAVERNHQDVAEYLKRQTLRDRAPNYGLNTV